MRRTPTIFLSYAREWRSTVEVICDQLVAAGCKPWMDSRDLLPGTAWKKAIDRAIRESDIYLACVSKQFVGERRFLQREIKIALDALQGIGSPHLRHLPAPGQNRQGAILLLADRDQDQIAPPTEPDSEQCRQLPRFLG